MLRSAEEHLPLTETKKFHRWVASEMDSGTSALTLFEYLSELKTDIALLRSFNIAHWFLSRDIAVDAAQRCENVADRSVEFCGRAYLLYIKLATKGFVDKDNSGTYIAYVTMLEGELEELLGKPKNDLAREAEIYLRHTLSTALFFAKEYKKANSQIARCQYLAESLGGIYYLGRINSLYTSINYEMGRIADAATTALREKHNNYNSEAIAYFHERGAALLLFILGQNEQPIFILQKMLTRYSKIINNDKPHRTLYELSVYISRCQALLGSHIFPGTAPIPEDITNQSKTARAIANAMSLIIEALGSKRETRQMKSRYNLLEEASATWAETRFVSLDKAEFDRRWIKAYAHFKQGAYLKAWSTIQFMSLEDFDWLDLRTLYAGLRLELAMCLWLDEDDIAEAEKALRSVFERAARLPHASEEGLAERLMHWFPLASAYGALMPNPIHHLQPALTAVLKVGSKNSVHDIDLSPSITAEFILKALDYDLRPGEFQQFDTPANRRIRDSLLTTYGEVPYYLPYVSAVSLVLGFKEAGHHKRARSVAREYGVVPQKMQSSYKMYPILEELRAATQALLDDEITTEMFRDVIRMTTLENSPLNI